MSRWPAARWWRPAWWAVLVVGLALLAGSLGAGRGQVVGQIEADVPGAPPWTQSLTVPRAGESYLLRSAVTFAAKDRRSPAASPRLRVTGPDGQPADSALEPLAEGRTVARGRTATVLNQWRLTAAQPGRHGFELTELRATPPGLRPLHWRLELLAGAAPASPDQRLALGFALAAAAFLILVAGRRPANP